MKYIKLFEDVNYDFEVIKDQLAELLDEFPPIDGDAYWSQPYDDTIQYTIIVDCKINTDTDYMKNLINISRLRDSGFKLGNILIGRRMVRVDDDPHAEAYIEVIKL